MSTSQTTPDFPVIAKKLTRDLIDCGARCQKAKSFTVSEKGTEMRSVYDVVADEVERYLRDAIDGR